MLSVSLGRDGGNIVSPANSASKASKHKTLVQLNTEYSIICSRFRQLQSTQTLSQWRGNVARSLTTYTTVSGDKAASWRRKRSVGEYLGSQRLKQKTSAGRRRRARSWLLPIPWHQSGNQQNNDQQGSRAVQNSQSRETDYTQLNLAYAATMLEKQQDSHAI